MGDPYEREPSSNANTTRQSQTSDSSTESRGSALRGLGEADQSLCLSPGNQPGFADQEAAMSPSNALSFDNLAEWTQSFGNPSLASLASPSTALAAEGTRT